MNKVDLELEFDIGHCNGSMSFTIMCNDSILEKVSNIVDKKYIVKTQMSLPGTIKILVFNKNMNTDTKIDSDGNILEDKFIQLRELRMGRIAVSSAVLKNLCSYTRNKETVQDTYWGFPGMVEIEFNQAEVVAWHLINNPTNFNIVRQ